MKLAETIILTILIIFSLAVAPSVFSLDGSGWGDGWGDGWEDGWDNSWEDDWDNGWDDGWDNGWDVDDGAGEDDGDTDPNDWGDEDPEDTPDTDWPTHWNKLDPQTVLEDSADRTIVYADLANQCLDEDSPVNVQIVNHVSNYDLEMAGGDLVISNLQENYWDNGELVALSCNGVASFFKLTIAPVNDAPEIINLNDLTINMNDGPLVINLENHEYDVDNTHSQLSWTVAQRSDSRAIFDAELSGKSLTITPKSRGGGYLWFRLEDPAGLFDEKRISVRVVSGDQGGPSQPDEEDDDRIGIFVSSIRISGDGNLEAGEELEAFVSIKNSGDDDLENVKITMVIQDIAARGVAGPFDLDDGETTTKLVRLVIDEDAVISEKVYDARFTVSNDNTRRVVYREVDVDLG